MHWTCNKPWQSPADCGRGQRSRKRKSNGKVPAQRVQKRRASTHAKPVDETDSQEAEEEEHDEIPIPVIVDGEEEWVVEKITASRVTKFQTESGEWEWETEYEVHWVGGEVTWEPLEVVQDCEALDEFERMKAARKGKK